MASLWRVLALAWLGGSASPVLADDALGPETQAVEQAEPAPDESIVGEDGSRYRTLRNFERTQRRG
jgi:hypothetical protein